MSKELIRQAVGVLLTELYDGPPNPRMTWVVNNAADSGVLGTARGLSAVEASARPPGVRNSIAAHVGHLRFSLNTGLAYARGEDPKPVWAESWQPQTVDEVGWATLQSDLESSYRRLAAWAKSDEPFEQIDSLCGFFGTAAHAAYHLGAIRQLAAVIRGAAT